MEDTVDYSAIDGDVVTCIVCGDDVLLKFIGSHYGKEHPDRQFDPVTYHGSE